MTTLNSVYIGDEIIFKFTAKDSEDVGPTSATVDVYNHANTKIIDAIAATVDDTTVSYNLDEASVIAAGLYRAVFTVIWSGVTRRFQMAQQVHAVSSLYRIYGSVKGIEALIGDVVSSRIFTSTTIPNVTQVQNILASVAAEMNVELKQQGYAVPINPNTSPIAYEYAVAVNNAGAAARTLGLLPQSAYTIPQEEMSGGDRRAMLDRELWHFLQRCRRYEIPADYAESQLSKFYAGSNLDRATGETKKPLFKRGMFDNPGSRILQE
jgi:hypothetical protein